jgi:4-amino-4-deoxy-L-arabinose transferase-like glycosyltransferase
LPTTSAGICPTPTVIRSLSISSSGRTSGLISVDGVSLGAVARDIRRVRSVLTMREHALRVFLWLWILIPVVFFSFSGSKLPGYILPIFPAIALLAGLEVSEAPNARWRIASTSLLVLSASIAFCYVRKGTDWNRRAKRVGDQFAGHRRWRWLCLSRHRRKREMGRRESGFWHRSHRLGDGIRDVARSRHDGNRSRNSP